MKHIYSVVTLFVLSMAGSAQTPTNLNMLSPVPPAPVASVNVVGNQGTATYTYWVVVNYAGGAVIGQAATVQRAPATLTGGNFVNIGWTTLQGAVTYDVVRLLPPNQFTGTCSSCAVATGLTTTSTVDNGGVLGSYSLGASAPVGNGTFYINNRDYAPPQARQIVNGVDASIGGGGSPVTITLTGTANQITLTGTCSGSTGITCAFSVPIGFVLPGTINGLTITTGTGTLTIANAKTLTVNNTVTWTGTDGSTLQYGAGGTIFYTSTTLGCAQMPVLTGDASNTACAITVNQVNGAVVPLSATALASNASRQLIAATLQGNGAKVQASTGTTTTNDCVKFDANGNTVDAGSACGSGGISGLTPNTVPKAASSTTLNDSSITDDGTTVSTVEDFVAKSVSSSGSSAGIINLTNHATPGTVKANSWGWTAPATITTSWYGQAPNASPSANQVMLFSAPTSNVSPWVWTSISGSGSFCMTISCLMTTPNLGTPSAAVGTNFTGIPPGAVTAAQGNGTKFQFSTGSVTTNNCAKFDASGNVVDAGGACGTATSSSAVSNITPVTVTGTTSTSAQILQQLTIPAALFNILGAPFTYNASGIYSLVIGQTPTLTFTANLCTINGCGSGTVRALAVIVTPTTTTATNNTWNIRLTISTTATGATGTVLTHGTAIVELTTASDLGTASSDSNTTSSGTIDLTSGLFIQLTVTTSTGNVGNSITNDKSSLEPASAQGATGATGPTGPTGTSGITQIGQSIIGGASTGVCTSTASTVTCTAIPGTYSGVQIQILARSAAAVNQDNLVVKGNADTGNNYSAQFAEFDNTASIIAHSVSGAPAAAGPASVPGASATANTAGVITADIVGYTSTTFFKNANFSSGWRDSSAAVTHKIVVWWEWASTSALTRLDFTLSSGGNFVTGSVITIYGLQ